MNYETKYTACSNSKSWNEECKKKAPCLVCKDASIFGSKGKYIPKTKKKIEKEINLGWDGNNASGFFSALAGGYRLSTGVFLGISSGNLKSYDGSGMWWMANESNSNKNQAHRFHLTSGTPSYLAKRYAEETVDKGEGLSIRCVKD